MHIDENPPKDESQRGEWNVVANATTAPHYSQKINERSQNVSVSVDESKPPAVSTSDDGDSANKASQEAMSRHPARLAQLAEENCIQAAASDGDEKKGRNKAREKRQRIVHAASVVNQDGWLGEVVYDPQKKPPMRFILSLGRPRAIGTSYKISASRSWLKPPDDPYDLVGRGVILLPSGKASYNTQKQLVEDLRAFIHLYVDVPLFWEELLAQYVLFTWVYDRFGTVPYLRFLGEAGEGKTRLLTVLNHVSYRPIFLSGAMTAPAAFRLIDTWNGTLFIDEADFRNSDMWSEIIKILNTGYKKTGGCVVRCVGKNFEPRPFNVFGPKIIANRSRFTDSALEGRCLTLEMEERPLRNDIPRQLLPDSPFFAEGLALRNKLLQWRFDCFDEIKVDESQLKQLPPRLAEIATPIWSVSNDSGFRERFRAFLRDSEVEAKTGDPKAFVVEAVQNIVQKRAKDCTFVNDGYLTIKAVTDEANELGIVRGVIEKEQPLSPRRVGAIVRSLKLPKGKPIRCNKGYRFQLNEDRLKELAAKYVPTEEIEKA